MNGYIKKSEEVINDECEEELITKMSIVNSLLHAAFLHVPTDVVEMILSENDYMGSVEILDYVERANNSNKRVFCTDYEQAIKDEYVTNYTNSLLVLAGDLIGMEME